MNDLRISQRLVFCLDLENNYRGCHKRIDPKYCKESKALNDQRYESIHDDRDMRSETPRNCVLNKRMQRNCLSKVDFDKFPCKFMLPAFYSKNPNEKAL